MVIPKEQLEKGKVEIKSSDLAGTIIANGRVRIPSPRDAGEDLMGFRWYNGINFWTSKGILFIGVVPFEGAVARPTDIKLGE